MADDKIVRDTARNPERESLGAPRGGIRAAAKRAAKKVAKKVATKSSQKKTSRRTTTAAGRSTKKVAKSAAKVSSPASRTTQTSRSGASSIPAPARTATKGGTADATVASQGNASAPAAMPYEPEPAMESPRPPGPMHPGATMDAVQEHVGGFGSLMALWGPLIIVAFLVLVFRGGEERESTVVASPDTATQAGAEAVDEMAHGPLARPAVEPSGDALFNQSVSEPHGAVRGRAETFDGGFTMRTSMATPTYAGGGPGSGMPPAVSGRLYPSPSGPYRDPRFRALPTGESWSAGGSGDWMWSAEVRGHPGRETGREAPVQWVRCAPPFYWCPAPSSPTW